MKRRPLRLGDVLLVDLAHMVPPGSEQSGSRPAVVAGLPDRLGTPRYPMIILVPMTTKIGTWAKRSPDLYPFYAAGTGGLKFDSVALVDHFRGLDTSRIKRHIGSFSLQEYAPIKAALEQMCQLNLTI